MPWWVCAYCRHRVSITSNNAVDDERLFTSLVWRLGNPVGARDVAEVETLVAVGEDAVPTVRSVLFGRYDQGARSAAVEALARIGGRQATEAVIQWSAEQERRMCKRRRIVTPLGIGLFLALFCLMVFGGKQFRGMSGLVQMVWWLMTAVLGFGAVRALRDDALQALAMLKDPRAVGPLVLALQDQHLSGSAEPILRELLPRVSEADCETFTGEERAAIVCMLNVSKWRMDALCAVACFGGADALARIERIAAEDDSMAVRDEAERALIAIRKRIALQNDRATLLRAHTDPDTSPETLLRAAAGQPETHEDLLLRASDIDG